MAEKSMAEILENTSLPILVESQDGQLSVTAALNLWIQRQGFCGRLSIQENQLYIDQTPCHSLEKIELPLGQTLWIPADVAGNAWSQWALEAAEVGLWIWDQKTGKVTWSAKVYGLFGIEPSDFCGSFEAYQKLIHPDDLPTLLQTIQKAMQSHEKYKVEHRVIWDDGSVHWLQGIGEVTLDPDGKLTGMVGAVVEISQRKMLEMALTQIAEFVPEKHHRGFFHGLVSLTKTVTSADYVILGLKPKNDPSYIETLVAIGPEGRLENFTYSLEGTPCDQTLKDRVCVYQDDVAEMFPQDFLLEEMQIKGYAGARWQEISSGQSGVLVALSQSPFVFPNVLQACLKILANKMDQAWQNQIHQKEIDRQAHFLKVVERSAKVGGWRCEIQGENLECSPNMLALHNLDLDEPCIRFEHLLELYKADSAQKLADAWLLIQTEQVGFDLHLSLENGVQVRWIGFPEPETATLWGSVQALEASLIR